MSPIVRNKIDPKPHPRPATDETSDTYAFEAIACNGPDEHGACPWASEDGKLPCDGDWITANGWTFRVAEDATLCPLTSLGIRLKEA